MVRLMTFWVLLVSLTMSPLAAAEVTNIEAAIDKNPVVSNESFVLTVTFNDDVGNNVYQPESLLDDFIVGRTSISRQTSITNGRLSKQTRFSTVLIAKQAGNYTIPAVQYNGVSSEPITVEVLAAGSEASQRAEQIAFIESTIDTTSVYLQQPLTYIVRLYLAADLNKGNLIPPTMDDADVRQIGTDQESSEMLNGRRYKVYQRTFQITPNKSGNYTINGARFDGEVYAQGQRSIFSSFSNTQPVSAIGDDTTITVKPVPSNWRGEWLPSDLVTLSQTLQPEATESLQVGEPVTLSYQLTAVGVKPEQLPSIEPSFPDSVQVYPDEDSTDQFVRNGVTIAQKNVSFALVPNQPGSLTIPAAQVAWFNTKLQQRQLATTDPIELTVEGVARQARPDNAQPVEDDTLQAGDASAPAEVPSTTPLEGDATTLAGQRTLWLLVVLLVISLLGNLAWLWRRKQRKPRHFTAPQSAHSSLTQNQQWRNFQKACADNTARKADEHLRRWAQQHFARRVIALSDIARWLAKDNQQPDAELMAQLNNLQHSLFSADKPKWTQGKSLYQALRKALDKQPKGKNKDPLPELYRA